MTKNRALLAIAAFAAALPLIAAVPAAVAPIAVHETDTEARLATAIRALPPEQRARIRGVRRTPPAQEVPATATMRLGALTALRKQHIVPHERARFDPAIRQRHVQRVATICAVLSAETRRAAGLNDANCEEAKARLAGTIR